MPIRSPKDLLRATAGRRALAWDGPASTTIPPDAPPGPADIIVPVHGAPEALARCLDSLLAHTDLARHRLLLVLDGPQPSATEEKLVPLTAEELIPSTAEAPAGIRVLRSAERRGFVASVNLGMAASRRDVVLLNSDTVVTAGWLEKLQAAAYSAPGVATATPFSNSATICSLPRWLETNALPAGETVDSFARRIEERSLRAYPRLPTGVGVCLYIKRTALEALGPFDERTFGLGYGEESEFCMRALKAGWTHVLDDATFIFHEGQRSFGASRGPRVARAHREMRRLHPEYLPTIARFLAEDPLAPVRERALAGLFPPRRTPAAPGRPRRPGRILHVVHGWPPWNHAGTELYAAWLARRQAAWREVAVYARIADPERGLGDAVELLDGGARVRLVVNNFVQRDPRSRNALRDRGIERDFARFVAEVDPDLVHVHHLAGHAFSLPAIAARRGVPLLYQVQDWWTPCARANLLDRDRRLCSGPGLGKCSRCLPLTGLSPAAALNRALYAFRGRLARRAFRRADAWVMGSRFIAESYREMGLLRPGGEVHVIPYGVELGQVPEAARPRPQLPLRFGFLGSIQPHKGLHVAAAAFAGIDPGRARLEVWGDPAIDPAYAAEVAALGGEAVRFHGPFAEAEKPAILAGVDALVVPSLGLESFGLAAREAMAAGVPVLASDRGALAELFAGRECGAAFDPEDPAALRGWIERLAARPETLAEWRRALPPVKGMAEHAEEIERVYERLLSGKKRERA